MGYENGQLLTEDWHFHDHMECEVPVQIYLGDTHKDIGFVEQVMPGFVKINNTYYNRNTYRFVSRPGF
ncbi:MAG: hypothetical protein BLM47_03615 [Candidatus Reconcilbacillus cellulovorans]|uniref:Uncharacterized protein n=1 Tax=Candidatus Reconcilbacillus cellulovorans TaxID=1906605 RepID=A0A2A6E2E1_9BACL|nr:MAG: hypothetical protein BLM47_03615 [Candidatus Reconcilbacillus cellulovorans]